jgi:hypothetical protein
MFLPSSEQARQHKVEGLVAVADTPDELECRDSGPLMGLQKPSQQVGSLNGYGSGKAAKAMNEPGQ